MSLINILCVCVITLPVAVMAKSVVQYNNNQNTFILSFEKPKNQSNRTCTDE